MRHPRRVATLMLCTAVAVLGGCAQPRGPASIDAGVDAILAGTGFSGAIVLQRGARIIHARGVGLADREAGRAFTPTTPSDGASIAKTFTAAALHTLVAEGRIGLDDPVARHVPEFPHAATRVRHLFAHSVGLPDYDFFDADLPPQTRRTTEAMLHVLARRQPSPSFEPGTRFEYANLGFDVAALIVERVSGEPFVRYVQQRLLAPLALRDTFPRPTFFAQWPVPRTLGYRERGGRWERFEVFDGEDFHGASNWMVSAQDLARWGAAFARSEGLPAAAQRAATVQARLDDGSMLPFSLGSWHCDASAMRCHFDGDLRAYQSFVHWDRDRGETVAYVANSTIPPWQRLRIGRELIALLAGQAPPRVDTTALMRLPRESMAMMAGTYAGSGLGTIELRVAGPDISLHRVHGPAYPVYRVTADTYYVPGLEVWLGFSGDAAPRTLHIRTIHGDEQAARQAAPPPA